MTAATNRPGRGQRGPHNRRPASMQWRWSRDGRPQTFIVASPPLVVAHGLGQRLLVLAERTGEPARRGGTLTRMGTLRSYGSSPLQPGRQAARRTSARRSTLRGRPCRGSRRGPRPAYRRRHRASVPASRGRAAARALRRLGTAVARAVDHGDERRDESTGPRTSGSSQPSASEHAIALESGRSTCDVHRCLAPTRRRPQRSAKRDHLVECEPPGVKLRALGRGNTPRSGRGDRS